MIDTRKEKTYTSAGIRHVMMTELGIERGENTIRKWMTRGILKRGELIRLERIDIGGQMETSLEAVKRFLAELNRRDN